MCNGVMTGATKTPIHRSRLLHQLSCKCKTTWLSRYPVCNENCFTTPWKPASCITPGTHSRTIMTTCKIQLVASAFGRDWDRQSFMPLASPILLKGWQCTPAATAQWKRPLATNFSVALISPWTNSASAPWSTGRNWIFVNPSRCCHGHPWEDTREGT